MATVQEFTLLQKSAITDIQADLEAAVEADRIAAQAAASTATTKANESAASSVKASQWAENNENVAVETGKFSAKHYSLKAAAQNAQMQAVYPTAAYRARVLTDSGNIQDLNRLTELYIKNLQLLDSTVFLWSGVSGMKTRTSGSNQFASKLYNMANKVQLFGSELVTNGTFTTNTTGWAENSGATLSVDTARLKVTNTAGTNGGATQSITTVVGKTYHLTYAFTLGAGNGQVRVGTTLGGSQLLLSPVLSATATSTVSFVPTATTTYLFFGCDSLVTTDFALFDNISVKQMEWVEGANDAVQTTEANQPYVGGLIAPNEVRKLKALIPEDSLDFTTLNFASNSPWSVTLMFRADGVTDAGNMLTIITNNTSDTNSNEQIYLHPTLLRRLIFRDQSAIAFDFGEVLSSNKINLVTLVANGNNNLSLYIEGKLISSATVNTAFRFGRLMRHYITGRGLKGELPHAQIHNRALSASEIQAQHDFLRLQIPEIEGVAIGNQYWPTSNYEGVVAGDGTAIPEVQNSDNVEKAVNGGFDTDEAWGKPTGVTISGGVMNVNNTSGSFIFSNQTTSNIIIGRYYKITYTVNITSGVFLGVFLGASSTGNVTRTTSGTYTEYRVANGTSGLLNLGFGIGAVLTVDNVSVEEIGWSQSTALYDTIYAQTTGTAAVKELAALKAAAMWCYHSNDVNNGAIYGKLYNWYAVKLISLYPPQGYRVAVDADFAQLQGVLGGSAVAGGKLKKEGLVYWSSLNTGGTNESGFSLIGTGRRSSTGVFETLTTFSGFWTPEKTRWYVLNNSAALQSNNYSTFPVTGHSLRLLRNSPVGPNERTITSTTIVSDIASTANSTQIPFGYSVASIRLRTTANLTNIKVELWNNFYSGTPALVATLITGKTANNTTMVFPVLADAPALLQDGTLRITATGANAFETIVEYNLQKNTF